MVVQTNWTIYEYWVRKRRKVWDTMHANGLSSWLHFPFLRGFWSQGWRNQSRVQKLERIPNKMGHTHFPLFKILSSPSPHEFLHSQLVSIHLPLLRKAIGRTALNSKRRTRKSAISVNWECVIFTYWCTLQASHISIARRRLRLDFSAILVASSEGNDNPSFLHTVCRTVRAQSSWI